VTGHQDKAGSQDEYCRPRLGRVDSMPQQLKVLANDYALCNRTVARAVALRFKDDYKHLGRQGAHYKSPHTCAHAEAPRPGSSPG
jgi:hypothetical protein